MREQGGVLVRSRGLRAARVRGAALGAAWVLALGAPAMALAQDWVISILEGEAVVVDGARRLVATAGQRLEPGAIIETTAKTGLLRVEGGDQSTYDLGPDTRAMLAPPGFPARNERVPQIYLLQGWLKATSRGPREAAGVLTPALEVLPFKGAVVLNQVKREHVAFIETGRVDLVERRVGGGPIAVNAGEFYGGEGSRRGSVSARPAPSWLQTVPRSFRDPIPLRAAAFRDRRVEPAALPAANYAQLVDWLSAEPTLRAQMPGRFASLTRDAAFRNEVTTHLSAHPEWGPIVAPEPRKGRANPGGSR